ncbi:MAG TPA: MFS transporter [Candidatus Lokiarchaeia archaeon]|nr:MFS transporter [Candidatus Lokiarchaeia archaeon]
MSEIETDREKEKDLIAGRKETQIVMNTANIIDNADAQLFPSVYPQVQSSMGLSIEQLGLITGVQSLLQSLTSPIWGWWNDRHSRKKVLTFGLFVWGIFTILMAFALAFYDMLVYRAIIGVGLACIVPTTSSVIADFFPQESRGKAFGWLGLTQFLGLVIGTLFATAIVEITPTILGMDSWRFVFIVWGVISIGIGVLVWVFARDPARGLMDGAAGEKGVDEGERRKLTWKDYKEILSNKTFLVIVLQGLAGSIPWNGLLFFTTFFEYVGFGPLTAGLIFALVVTGAACGNLLGGWVGDKAAKWSPKRGRILIAQISQLAGVPFLILFFFAIPMNPSSLVPYILLGVTFGLVKPWAGPGTNSPIFSEIFEPEIRGTVFGVDRVFEGSFQSLGTIFVSIIATLNGYQTLPVGQTIAQQTAVFNAQNAMALGMGMFWVGIVLWGLSTALYTLVYFFYPKDYEKMRLKMEERAKQRQMPPADSE